MSEPAPGLPEKAFPAFGEDDHDAGEPKLITTAAKAARGQQPFNPSLVRVCKLHGCAVLNLLYLGFQAMYLGDPLLEA